MQQSSLLYAIMQRLMKKEQAWMPPKGCMAVRVVASGGSAEAEEKEEAERFVVPVWYLKHPLFLGLLKEAEEEYGFQQQGPITIPCGVHNFRRVQGIIDHRHKHSGGHLPFHIADCCFRLRP